MARAGRPAADAPSARDEILRVARRHFAEFGYAATNVGDVVAAAGVTKPALYHHFGNKAGLYGAAVTAAIDEIVTELERRVMPEPAVLDRFEATIDVGIEFMRVDPSLARLVSGLDDELAHHPELADLVEQATRIPALFAAMCDSDDDLAAPRADVALMFQAIVYGQMRMSARIDADRYEQAANALRLLVRGELRRT
ncbi:hypothetical protein GCM10009547_18550 [Sporichthya brevicatena]|uniref:HTH tetR-type domain-containing protein n=1 Tax=Sporichthya brevicatena TaxID=171442 RepID=A0ABP3RTB2_9ACTN